ncbi:dipeptidylaminopeptidase/acylaminoacyl-peptidase [Isosphaera pallida ATCC 43644]|uniref:Dipeptidylaminopeptidase/acylaminoacyl-peptidase n=1 Tax=Isosphaera pallida (strain ATCC 43644 / DSM 9630 / IS1B) TaxID=575540 RepID=E8QYR3_ISOPI|nr:alpha/beta fold hydrolase [Isosphaera pallida]ADV61039.1 dipeptidylaminopeptidase/acylaminoacyl-peptidase [Isosphaera pallida ATCC 43644]
MRPLTRSHPLHPVVPTRRGFMGVAIAASWGWAGRIWACVSAASSYRDRHDRPDLVIDSQGNTRALRNRDEWNERRQRIREAMQQVMGPLPVEGPCRQGPLNTTILQREEVEHDGIPIRRTLLTYAPDPGPAGDSKPVAVPAWLLEPLDCQDRSKPTRRPAMLALHQTIRIGKDEPVGLGDHPNRRYGVELAARGFVVLAPDYPGFGAHRVDPYALGYVSATMKAIRDNLRGVDLLTALDSVDPARIGAIGHSLGGHNALFTAVFDERLAATVTSCGFTSFPRYKNGDLSGWSHQGYMPRIRTVHHLDPARMPFDFPEVVAAVAPRGLFVSAPLHDDNFDVQGVKDCLEAARPIFKLWDAPEALVAEFPDTGHDFPPATRQRAYQWLEQRLAARSSIQPIKSNPAE